MTTTPRAADPDAAQARLQGWRSRRPGAAQGAALEAILGLDEFLVRARQPPFGRWLEGMSAEPTLHEIDRIVRNALRRDCQAMASWYEPPWDTALARLAGIVDLPLLAHLMRGEGALPPMRDDPAWRALIDAPADERLRVAGIGADGDLLEAWMQSWLAALPVGAAEVRQGFVDLARAAGVYRAMSAQEPRGIAARTPLAGRLALLFRRHAGTPVAMACELAATALDLQRLRSGLVRRALAQRAAMVPA
jgi:hypothetical protein